jgi:hypothetical protein
MAGSPDGVQQKRTGCVLDGGCQIERTGIF